LERNYQKLECAQEKVKALCTYWELGIPHKSMPKRKAVTDNAFMAKTNFYLQKKKVVVLLY